MKRYMESFISAMKDFAQNIREKTPPPVTGIDGRNLVVMGMAVKKILLGTQTRPHRGCCAEASVESRMPLR